MDGLTILALAEGATVEFWSITSQGTTLDRMHITYESHFFLGALKSIMGGRPNKVAIATLLCLISGLRGPLFQRASVINSQFIHDHQAQYELQIAQLIPPHFLFLTKNFSLIPDGIYPIYEQYIQRSPIYLAHKCPGTCNGKVKVSTPKCLARPS